MRALLSALLFAALWVAVPADAHKPSDSFLTVQVDGERVTGRWDIALRDLDYALVLDANGDGALTWDEVRRRHADIAAYALARLELASERGACKLSAGAQLIDRHVDGAYTVLPFAAVCPGRPKVLTIGYRLFADTDPQHRGLVRIVSNGQSRSAVLGPDSARQSFDLASGTGQFGSFVREGVWHIWTGFDHLLFLLSLLLPAVLVAPAAPAARAFRLASADVLRVVTAFTLAHSITLALASLHVLDLPSRWIESAIAASVAVAALNNVVPLFPKRRAVVAFAFGLVHGCGFAGVLSGLGLSRSSLAVPLFGFNAGVELGQLAVVALFMPLAFVLRETWFYRRCMSAGSMLIMLVALVWFAERAFDLRLAA
jgi:hypothetical protein